MPILLIRTHDANIALRLEPRYQSLQTLIRQLLPLARCFIVGMAEELRRVVRFALTPAKSQSGLNRRYGEDERLLGSSGF